MKRRDRKALISPAQEIYSLHLTAMTTLKCPHTLLPDKWWSDQRRSSFTSITQSWINWKLRLDCQISYLFFQGRWGSKFACTENCEPNNKRTRLTSVDSVTQSRGQQRLLCVGNHFMLELAVVDLFHFHLLFPLTTFVGKTSVLCLPDACVKHPRNDYLFLISPSTSRSLDQRHQSRQKCSKVYLESLTSKVPWLIVSSILYHKSERHFLLT
jgi:hypothetical protein